MTDLHEPRELYLRRRVVIEWLDRLNPSLTDQFDKLVEAGLIERIVLVAGGRGYYLKSAVLKHLIQPFRDAEERLQCAPVAASNQPHNHPK